MSRLLRFILCAQLWTQTGHAEPGESAAKPKSSVKTQQRSAPKPAKKPAVRGHEAKPASRTTGKAKPNAKTKPHSKVATKRPGRSAHRVPSPPLGPPNSPAIRYAALDGPSCLSELKRRAIPFREEPHTPGVSIPVRLLGPLAGVVYRTDQSERERKNTPWEIYDCRLVLSLSDFSQILSAHGVSEVRIFSAYRPPPKNHDEQASKRHQAALAVDVRTLRKTSGEELSVLDDFEQKLGREPCSEADEPSRPAGKEIKTIACEAARAHLFNSILTPNYDDRHRNHFHLEVAPGKAWFLLR